MSSYSGYTTQFFTKIGDIDHGAKTSDKPFEIVMEQDRSKFLRNIHNAIVETKSSTSVESITISNDSQENIISTALGNITNQDQLMRLGSDIIFINKLYCTEHGFFRNFTIMSDIRLKKNISRISMHSSLDYILKLKPSKYNWKNNNSKNRRKLIRNKIKRIIEMLFYKIALQMVI